MKPEANQGEEGAVGGGAGGIDPSSRNQAGKTKRLESVME